MFGDVRSSLFYSMTHAFGLGRLGSVHLASEKPASLQTWQSTAKHFALKDSTQLDFSASGGTPELNV